MGTTPYARLPWQDRFNTPTVAGLRKGLQADAARLYDRANKTLADFDGVKQGFGWYGEGWQWTVEYRLGRVDAPFAVIVPAPEDLQLAIPLDRTFVGTIPVKDLKRTIRDGLELAQEPFDTSWGVWTIATPGILDDLRVLLDRKIEHLRAAVA